MVLRYLGYFGGSPKVAQPGLEHLHSGNQHGCLVLSHLPMREDITARVAHRSLIPGR